jgi:hypothetical protein
VYEDHRPMSDITAGIKAGRYHQGALRWVWVAERVYRSRLSDVWSVECGCWVACVMCFG